MTPAQHEALASAAETAGWPREEITLRVASRRAKHGCDADFVASVRRWEKPEGELARIRAEVRATGATADQACAAVVEILRA